MDICKDLNTITHFDKSVLTIGSFDGMHCGHIEIIKELTLKAANKGIPAIVITFEPHPKSILQLDRKEIFKVLMSIDKKLEVFERYGINYVWIIPFDRDIMQITAKTFLDKYIMKYFNPEDIIFGYDNNFGYNREGNSDFLNIEKDRYNYNLCMIEPIIIDDVVVSSSMIRNYLKQGKLETANNYLGRVYELYGKVVKGNKLGKKLDFPTANIHPITSNQLIPSRGVYCVDAIINNRTYNGMCNIGVRPTFYKNGEDVIEVHLITNDLLSLYGKGILIKFREYIRKEKKYDSAADLVNQLKQDRHACMPN